ncbi:MAG: hypothetical protein ABIQ12_07070 [Opitutaceae bacterium]
MNSSDSNPKLPAWPFILADVALILAAIYIALNSDPITINAVIAIVACVGIGAIVGLVPLVARHEWRKNEALDERQRALEGLAQTVSSSAEQLSVAAGGLHEIADLAQRSVRQAEQLPHKLQEKISEFQAQLATAADTEKEELERELLALRTTESERLETVSQRIAKATAEWTKLEAATQQHLTAAQDALVKVSARAIAAIESAKPVGLVELAARVAAVTRDLEAKIAQLETVARAGVVTAPMAAEEPVREIDGSETPTDDAEPVPKRARKVRRDERAPTEGATAEPFAVPPVVSQPVDEPPPVPAEKIVEVAPVAPGTSEPFADNIAPTAQEEITIPPLPILPAAAAPVSIADEPREPRKRAPKKAATSEAEEPALQLDDAASSSAASVAERVITSDGATRLIVTAYIGIGNRLFIRGAGPGLSWEKGVPLQFVSIGKWRWETNDAVSPVQFRLYKNDDLECAALGAQSLDPGHQQELTAAF